MPSSSLMPEPSSTALAVAAGRLLGAVPFAPLLGHLAGPAAFLDGMAAPVRGMQGDPASPVDVRSRLRRAVWDTDRVATEERPVGERAWS